jgi:MFS family permease
VRDRLPHTSTRASNPAKAARKDAPRNVLIIAYAVVFIAFTDNFSMFPTIGPYTRHLGGDALAMGVTVAAYSVTNLLFNVVGGIMLDRSGRRRLLLAGLVLAAGSMLLYAAANSVSSLIMVRLIHGAAGGILVPAVFTMIADLAPAGSSGRAMGRAGALIGTTAIIAPALAGIIRQAAGFNPVFYLSAAMLTIGVLLTAFGLPETRGRSSVRKRSPGAETKTASASGASMAWIAYCGVFTLTFAMGILTAFLPDMAESLGYRAGASGMLFTTFVLVAAVVMISPLSQLVDHRGSAIPVIAGMLMMTVSLALLMFTMALSGIILACAIFGAGYGLIFPATSGQIALASESRRGRAYGVFYAMFSLGIIAGAPLGGWMKTAFPVNVFPFLTAYLPALLICLAGITAVTLLSRKIRIDAGMKEQSPANNAHQSAIRT